ncbi:MAG: hypothetical protein LQ347_005809 [Umbilicaria vellea]|nr:MAG: hypothetical protein LQ347_005809 [Umbilicaria vellea]
MALDSAANVVQALGRVDEGPLEATLDANVHVTGVPQSDAVFSTSKTAHDLKDRLLHFLSTASNETLGACLVGLGASTYLVLGRLGLVLIGVAGGIVLHATWEGNTQVGAEDEVTGVGIRKRREGGLDIVERVLDWRDSKNGAQSKDEDGGQDVEFMISTRKELDFAAFQPATGAALTSLVNAVIRDYVKWWYGPLLPSETSFPFACRQTLIGFFLAVSSHLSRKRPADTFLDFLTHSSSIVIVFLNELSRALMASGASADPIEAVNLYLEENPESNLAHIVDLGQQKKKLKSVADDILQMFLDHKAYNCEPVKVFLREVLAGLVLEMTVQSCSKPDWINGWIVQILEEGEPELMNAIDAGMGDVKASEARYAMAQALVNESSASRINDPDESSQRLSDDSGHKKRISKAENAMEEAMLEAKRLSELIAAEDAKTQQDFNNGHSPGTTTQEIATPTSSQSDLLAASNTLPEALEDEDTAASTFTSFDQIIPLQQPTALRDDGAHVPSPVPPLLTLHNANVSIFDDSQPGEKGSIRSKPAAEYLLQIEPASSQHPGWMIARKYADFETLHEVLRRISVISGVAVFAQKYPTIPSLKGLTKSSLRTDLERYLHVALSYSRLAESEGMKRFLERDQAVDRSSPAANKGVFGFPNPAAFETVGKVRPKELRAEGNLFWEVSLGCWEVSVPLDKRSRLHL